MVMIYALIKRTYIVGLLSTIRGTTDDQIEETTLTGIVSEQGLTAENDLNLRLQQLNLSENCQTQTPNPSDDHTNTNTNEFDCLICSETHPISRVFKFCEIETCMVNNFCKSCFLNHVKKNFNDFTGLIRCPFCNKQYVFTHVFDKLIEIANEYEELSEDLTRITNWNTNGIGFSIIFQNLLSNSIVAETFTYEQLTLLFEYSLQKQAFKNIELMVRRNEHEILMNRLCLKNDDVFNLDILSFRRIHLQPLQDFLTDITPISAELHARDFFKSYIADLLYTIPLKKITLNINNLVNETIRSDSLYEYEPIHHKVETFALNYTNDDINDIKNILHQIAFYNLREIVFTHMGGDLNNVNVYNIVTDGEKNFKRLRIIEIHDSSIMNILSLLRISSNIVSEQYINLKIDFNLITDRSFHIHETFQAKSNIQFHLYFENSYHFEFFSRLICSSLVNLYKIIIAIKSSANWDDNYNLSFCQQVKGISFFFESDTLQDTQGKILFNNNNIKQLEITNRENHIAEIFTIFDISSKILDFLGFYFFYSKSLGNLSEFINKFDSIALLSFENFSIDENIVEDDNMLQHIKPVRMVTVVDSDINMNFAKFLNKIDSMEIFYYKNYSFINYDDCLEEISTLSCENLEIIVIFSNAKFKYTDGMDTIIKDLSRKNKKLRKVIFIMEPDELHRKFINNEYTKPEYYDNLTYLEVKRRGEVIQVHDFLKKINCIDGEVNSQESDSSDNSQINNFNDEFDEDYYSDEFDEDYLSN